MTSPSIPITSVMLVVRREPSRRRFTCTIRSTESAIWREIASLGTLMSDIITMFSIRARHSRGLLEWRGGTEPAWAAVFAGGGGEGSLSPLSPRGIPGPGARKALVVGGRGGVAP